jgi:hypothetical protein
MKPFVFALLCICLCLCGCGDSKPIDTPPPAPQQPVPKRPPTPEEALGIERPGKLAASVEAWANSNELGDYYRQSRDRLANLHAQLIEDYNVRMESELPPTDFTYEMLRKYHEAFEADSALRKFMVECYSRKEVRPLPKTIARVFTTAVENREEMRMNLQAAPGEITRLKAEFETLKSRMNETGTISWTQEKELGVWRDLKNRIGDISSRANKASAQASALAANMAQVQHVKIGDDEIERLADEAERLKADWSSFASQASRQLEIVNGQMLLTKFADDCKAMAEGMTKIPAALAKKKARQAEIQELISRITSSRTRGYADLDALAQQAASIKSRSRSEGERETELGLRVQKLAGNYEGIFGDSAIYRLKRELPEPSARARVDSCLAAFKRTVNAPANSDLAGVFVNIESKSYQLADRMEEEAMLKRMDETLLAVQRLAARKR